jgi:hypothetical protein
MHDDKSDFERIGAGHDVRRKMYLFSFRRTLLASAICRQISGDTAIIA